MSDLKQEMVMLYARLDDLRAVSERGEVAMSSFLTPSELHFAAAYLRRAGCSFFEYGGYPDAERKRIYTLPDYLEGIADAAQLCEYGYNTYITPLKISGSGFVRLTHRAFMGSVLGLGIERSVIGDIAICSDSGALLFCDASMADFVLQNLERVGKDKVKVGFASPNEYLNIKRSYEPLNDTVASPRLDCVVAALCSLSRERAGQTVISGLVELEYENEERPDREVKPPCIISVRGYGKYRVLSLGDKTRKGRYRLFAEKFI